VPEIAAQERGLEGVGHVEVVEELAVPGQQPVILAPLSGGSDHVLLQRCRR
jgi:hypothetical protein